MNMSEFFHMGGYALYVWTSYGLAFAVLALNLVLPLRRHAQTLQSLARAQRQEARRQTKRSAEGRGEAVETSVGKDNPARKA